MEISDLVPLLHAKTKQQKLNWQITRDDEIAVRVGETLVEIDNDEDGLPRVALRNKDGKVVEVQSFQHTTELAKLIAETMEAGVRSALKIDETLSDVYSKLSSL